MCIYLNFNKTKECITSTMVPSVYCHVVARQSCTAGIITATTGGKATLRCRLHSGVCVLNIKLTKIVYVNT